MAPRTRAKPKPKPKPKSKPTRKPRITQCKNLSKSKNIQEASIIEDSPSCSSTATSFRIDSFEFDDTNYSTSVCSTPKAKKFRIPEIETCPPAPKKQRVISNCSLKRRPIAFFASPDLELFFFCALRHDHISV
ncbi:cyclin-dependent protein kinase inhibitor SMR13 [Mercurialis annua]|uniref:cyclin-dependent protein kinase inhibitor SMR13 n=1 Tax=Mercurialis annua TaxID=3986 RepID=UPI00215EEA6A|nr:cyclin-dependent protein kinase inhibitor SMR13 [Mercurialis annua]